MFTLSIKTEMEGVTNFRPLDTEEDPFEYFFIVQCTSCRMDHNKPVTVNRFETRDLSGSRGEANFVWKCQNCKRESSATFKSAPKPITGSDPPKLQPLIEFDCRGLEFTKFMPMGQWLAEGSESNTKFTEIEVSDDDWYDYDEKAGQEVSIKVLECEIHRS